MGGRRPAGSGLGGLDGVALAFRRPALNGRPYLLLCLTMIGWAGNVVVGRIAVGHVSPMVIVASRWLVVMVVVGLLARRALRAEWRLAVPYWRYFFGMGGLGFTVFNALFYWSAHYTSAVNIGVIQGVTPALVMAGAFLAFGTRISLLQAAGVAISVLGTVVVASRGSPEVLRHFAFNVGDLGILAASLLYAGYTVGLRQRPALSPMVLFAAMACAAFLTSLPLAAVEVVRGEALWPDATGCAVILYISLGPSLVCHLTYMRAVQLVGPNRAGIFTNLVPILSAAFAVGLLGEPFGRYHAVGLVLVLGGIWLAEKRRITA